MCLKHSFTHVFLSAADQVKREAGLVFPVNLDSNTSISHGRITQTIEVISVQLFSLVTQTETGLTEF